MPPFLLTQPGPHLPTYPPLFTEGSSHLSSCYSVYSVCSHPRVSAICCSLFLIRPFWGVQVPPSEGCPPSPSQPKSISLSLSSFLLTHTYGMCKGTWSHAQTHVLTHTFTPHCLTVTHTAHPTVSSPFAPYPSMFFLLLAMTSECVCTSCFQGAVLTISFTAESPGTSTVTGTH